MINIQRIYLTDYLLNLLDLQDKNLYLDLEKTVNVMEAYMCMLPDDIREKRNLELDSSEFKNSYNNLRWKIEKGYPIVCLDVVYKGLYIPLECFYIQVHIH